MLAMVTDDIKQTVSDIVEVNNFLLDCKGFGVMGTGKVQRIMYAAILVAQEYKKQCSENVMEMAAINSVSLLIAEQAAIVAVIAATAAASSASD